MIDIITKNCIKRQIINTIEDTIKKVSSMLLEDKKTCIERSVYIETIFKEIINTNYESIMCDIEELVNSLTKTDKL